MISQLKGIIKEKNEKTISITILESLSFEFFVINTNDFILQKEYVIYIAMLFSPEKGYVLYGFLELIQKKYFLVLQDCHGVGPKLALQILLHLSLDQIYTAMSTENKLIFESIPGIGKKKADMLILELKSKINHLIPLHTIVVSPYHDDFIASLKALGYTPKEITTMVELVYQDEKIKNLSLSQLISKTLILKNNLS